MSVFQLNEWWGVQVACNEEFDLGCLCIGNVDNSLPPTDKIVVGSLEGMIRIYNPVKPQYRIEDLILEESLGFPILQLLVGRFIPSTECVGLAVLHPRKLVVYEISPHGQVEGKANYHVMRKAYEHILGVEGKHFTAYNMTSGPFGGARGRDMFMVQSLDGKLQIFEQSANAFTRQLVDCLLPGPIAYLPRLDAFVSTNYACQAECYRYQVLASSQADVGARDTSSKSKGEIITGSFGLTSVRTALVEWSINLGESCRQIEEGCFSKLSPSNNSSGNMNSIAVKDSGEILMLCERSLYLLKESGGVIQQRRLEKDPSCMCKYRVGSSSSTSGIGSHNFLIASRDGTLSVFSEFNLVWAAKLSSVPVQMAVSDFGGQRGLVVTLDDTGKLSVGFMGTKPPLTAVPSLTGANTREVDYDRLDEEHRGLLQSENKAERKDQDRLVIRCQVPRTLDGDLSAGNTPGLSPDQLPPDLVPADYGMDAGIDSSGGYIKVCLRVYLTHTGDKPACNISLVASCSSFIHVAPRNVVIQKVGGIGQQSTPIMVKLYLYALKSHLPTGLDIEIVATYQSANKEPRIAHHSISVPLLLACRPRAAQKTAQHKITLDTTHAAVPLSMLFEDFITSAKELGDVGSTTGGAFSLGFQLWSNSLPASTSSSSSESAPSNNSMGAAYQPPAVVSILVSKNTGRYRVQSDCLPALLLILSELERRLAAHIGGMEGSIGRRHVTCDDEYPLTEYFAAIKSHFELRGKLSEQLSLLNDSAHQYRMVQKRLLVRFKDRNPTPLLGLDALMHESYDNILRISDNVQDTQSRLKKLSGDLACLSRIVAFIVTLKCSLSEAERGLLESYLCPDLQGGGGTGGGGITDQGWEETMDASLTFLLKTALAKNAKESATLPNSALEMPSEIDTLLKHIQMVLDRLGKGARLTALTPPTSSGVSGSTASNESTDSRK